MLGGWSAVGEQAGTGLLQWIALGVPLLFAALMVVLVLRAIARQGRYRATGMLDEADRGAVREALAQAERRTVGEILPVVVGRSDAHPGAEWLAALSLVLVGSAVLFGLMPWQQPIVVVLSQVALGGLGFLLARLLPDFKRMFIREDRATEVAQEQAFQEFYRNGLHKTEAATGVLLFVSLLEHRAVVLADEGIDAKVDAEFWADTDDAILDGIRSGSLRDGLIAGILRAGDLLAEQFPWREGDRDEIPDRVIVREE